MIVNCAEWECDDKAYYLIVYGCLDAHIRELLLCFHHGETWAMSQQEGRITCSQCRQPIDSYEFRWVDKLEKLGRKVWF